MKIILGLILMALPCFGLGYIVEGSFKGGLLALFIFIGLVCFATGMSFLGLRVIN